MRRKSGEPSGGPGGGRSLPTLLLVSLAAFSLVYMGLSSFRRRPLRVPSAVARPEEEECCRGMEGMELWGAAVKWGRDFRFNSSRECCEACRGMCRGVDGPCLCDSWVFCGDRQRCGEKFGECWLKKQKDVLHPAIRDSPDKFMWTSGLIFGKGEGIIGLETYLGVLRIKLFPECALRSVSYILELLKAHHCPGCEFYRAEGRGNSWNSEGNHIDDAPYGPPYGLIQGTLEAEGVPFPGIPKEACPLVTRGSVSWVGSGPEFVISLANHDEWKRAYTIFGSVLPEDMIIAEKIARLPTKPDLWGNINVTLLEKPVPLKLKHLTMASADKL